MAPGGDPEQVATTTRTPAWVPGSGGSYTYWYKTLNNIVIVK